MENVFDNNRLERFPTGLSHLRSHRFLMTKGRQWIRRSKGRRQGRAVSENNFVQFQWIKGRNGGEGVR